MSTTALIGILGALALILVAPRAHRVAEAALEGLRSLAPALIGSAALFAGMLWLARDVVDVGVYVRHDLLASTAVFGLLWAIALRFESASARVVASVLRLPAGAWAALVFAGSLAAGQLLLDGIPHTSDGAAYLFQARTFALGRPALEIPEHVEFFDFIHLSQHAGTWQGIMQPGWPALLALGLLLGIGPLVNPLCAAGTLLLLHGALRRMQLGDTAVRLAMAAFALSPLPLFLAGSTMSHSANLLFFALFLFAWVRLVEDGQLAWAALAGLALGINLTVRPIDAALAAAPFGLHGAWLALRDVRWWPRLLATGAGAGVFVAMLLAYNAALTGDPLVFPMELHFASQNTDERFGYGFGADMGTKIHGDEWPGYYPSDAPRVTSHRLLQWWKDFHGIPLLSAAALLAALPSTRGRWLRLLGASAALLIAGYGAHFYHGLAYGARHYALALPGALVVMAAAIARALEGGGLRAVAVRAALTAGLAHLLLFALPPLVTEYGHSYRMASGGMREAVERDGLTRALVFVHPAGWGWKSAFPLNEYPLESNDVLFARDLGARNAELLRALPDRRAYRARFGPDRRVRLTPLAPDERAPD